MKRAERINENAEPLSLQLLTALRTISEETGKEYPMLPPEREKSRTIPARLEWSIHCVCIVVWLAHKRTQTPAHFQAESILKAIGIEAARGYEPLFQHMVRIGVLESKRSRHGGFRFDKEWTKKTFADVVNALGDKGLHLSPPETLLPKPLDVIVGDLFIAAAIVYMDRLRTTTIEFAVRQYEHRMKQLEAAEDAVQDA